ncbi:hypothetical protein WJX79_009301 [Trebouxia sp. C0005]
MGASPLNAHSGIGIVDRSAKGATGAHKFAAAHAREFLIPFRTSCFDQSSGYWRTRPQLCVWKVVASDRVKPHIRRKPVTGPFQDLHRASGRPCSIRIPGAVAVAYKQARHAVC